MRRLSFNLFIKRIRKRRKENRRLESSTPGSPGSPTVGPNHSHKEEFAGSYGFHLSFEFLRHSTLLGLQQIVFEFMLSLLTTNPYVVALPTTILVTAAFKVAKMRGMRAHDYQARVRENITETISQEIMDEHLRPLFEENAVQIPQGPAAYDVVLRMLDSSADPLTLAAQIYSSLAAQGVESPFYAQALEIVAILGLG